MFAKIWFLSGPKNLKTNQNTGFIKPQCLTKNLRYEDEFLDMTKGPKKQ